MLIEFTESADEDYRWWQQNDPKKTERIRELLRDMQGSPFQGIGKPKPLKFDLHGYWSRRIDKTHRLVYAVKGKKVIVLACRFHY